MSVLRSKSRIRQCLIAACWSLSGLAATQAQSKAPLQGIVLHKTDKTPLARVVVEVFDKEKKLLHYTLTDAQGRFNLPQLPQAEQYIFSLFGYQPYLVAQKALAPNSVITLLPQTQQLEAVIVKIPPIRQKKDTLSYDPEAFSNQHDRYLADVLKKLPGLEVKENGQILYRGDPINKFYIEGLDLLGLKYNQATKNIPTDAVSQIQLLEAHQPIKALEKKVPSKQAAINIKLKKSHLLRPFGEAALGIGAPAFLWHNKLFSTWIHPKNQALINAKMSNIGKDLAPELQELGIDYLYEENPKTALSLSFRPNGPVTQDRFLYNNSYIVSLNDLIKLSETATLRFNIPFYYDNNRYTDSSHFQWGENAASVITFENIQRNNRVYALYPEIRYEDNNPKRYLLSELKGGFSNLRQYYTITGNLAPRTQSARKPELSIQHKLSWIYNRPHKIWHFHTLTRYFDIPEQLQVRLNTLTPFQNNLDETLKSRELLHKSEATTSFLPGDKQTLNAAFFLLIRNTDYRTDITHTEFSALKNQLSRTHYRIGLRPSYRLYFFDETAWVDTEIPLALNNIQTRPALIANTWYIDVVPALSLHYPINYLWTLRLNTSYASHALNNHLLMPAIFSDYRTQTQAYLPIDITPRYQASTTLSYKDLLRMWFIQIKAGYTYARNNFYLNYDYKQALTLAIPTPLQNPYQTFNAQINADKAINDLKLNIKTRINYHYIRSLQAQNTLFFYNQSHIINTQIATKYTATRWLYSTYTFTAQFNTQINPATRPFLLSNFSNELQLFTEPIKGLKASLLIDYKIIPINRQHFRTILFSDVSVDYSPHKKIDLSFVVQNLLNTKQYFITQNNGINFSAYFLPLRTRYFLFSVFFRF